MCGIPSADATLARLATAANVSWQQLPYCEASPPGVQGPLSCPTFPGDLQYYSPTVRVNVTLATPVENLHQPLQVQMVFDNNDRCLLIDLDSLLIELVWDS